MEARISSTPVSATTMPMLAAILLPPLVAWGWPLAAHRAPSPLQHRHLSWQQSSFATDGHQSCHRRLQLPAATQPHCRVMVAAFIIDQLLQRNIAVNRGSGVDDAMMRRSSATAGAATHSSLVLCNTLDDALLCGPSQAVL